jgi:hypothetical protein
MFIFWAFAPWNMEVLTNVSKEHDFLLYPEHMRVYSKVSGLAAWSDNFK